MNEFQVTKVNNVPIVCVENNDKRLIPIKPICEALGIDWKVQYSKLKEEEDLSATMVLNTTVAADGKEREMVCLPYEFIFGWLFTINPKNVKQEAQSVVRQYRMQCYKALYEHFTEPQTFLKEKQQMIDKYLDEYEAAKTNFRDAKKIMDEKQKVFNQVRNFSIEEWRENGRQYLIPFSE